MNAKSIMVIAVIFAAAACKRNNNINIEAVHIDDYSSMSDFHEKNQVPVQYYMINGMTGGSFTTPQGTVVTIPPQAFINTLTGAQVTGDMTVQIKDVYKKSDMLLSDLSTIDEWGSPIKSGGAFFISVLEGGRQTGFNGESITIHQPYHGIAEDGNMDVFFGRYGAAFGLNYPVAWVRPDSFPQAGQGTLDSSSSGYIFSLFQFGYPTGYVADTSTWCSSDNGNFFNAYPKTVLNIRPLFPVFSGEVFLVFKNLPCMIHVYKSHSKYDYDHLYNYAPVGFQVMVVAVEVLGGKLYSSFVPLTIIPNSEVNFSMVLTTTEIFKARLRALD